MKEFLSLLRRNQPQEDIYADYVRRENMFVKSDDPHRRNAGNITVVIVVIVLILIVGISIVAWRMNVAAKEKARIAEQNKLAEEKRKEQDAERARQMENLNQFAEFVKKFAEIDSIYTEANNMRIDSIKKSKIEKNKSVVDAGFTGAKVLFLSINDKVAEMPTVYAFEDTATISDTVRRAINSQELATNEYIQGYTNKDEAGVSRAQEDEKAGDEEYAKALERMVAAVQKHNAIAKEIGGGTYEELEAALQESIAYYMGGKYSQKTPQPKGKLAPAGKGSTMGTGAVAPAGEGATMGTEKKSGEPGVENTEAGPGATVNEPAEGPAPSQTP